MERPVKDEAALERQEAGEGPGAARSSGPGAVSGAAWGAALGIGLLSGITVPALKDSPESSRSRRSAGPDSTPMSAATG